MKLTFDAGKVPLQVAIDSYYAPELAFNHFFQIAKSAGHNEYESSQVAQASLEALQSVLIDFMTNVFEDIAKDGK